MKNLSLYALLPAVLLLAFLFTPGVGYFSAQKQFAARDQGRAMEVSRQKAAEDARRAEIQKRAEEDAIERQKEREQQERLKEEKKQRDYEDAISKLKEDVAAYSSESDTFAKEYADLEVKLVQLRDRKEAEDRATFELAKQVELGKIERRTAEMEIQRMVGMVSGRLSSSPILAPPPPIPSPGK